MVAPGINGIANRILFTARLQQLSVGNQVCMLIDLALLLGASSVLLVKTLRIYTKFRQTIHMIYVKQNIAYGLLKSALIESHILTDTLPLCEFHGLNSSTLWLKTDSGVSISVANNKTWVFRRLNWTAPIKASSLSGLWLMLLIKDYYHNRIITIIAVTRAVVVVIFGWIRSFKTFLYPFHFAGSRSFAENVAILFRYEGKIFLHSFYRELSIKQIAYFSADSANAFSFYVVYYE